MRQIDWSQAVDLHRRGPLLDDGTFEISRLASGTLSDVVGRVFQMPGVERANIWIDGDSIGTLGIFDILALSMRADFPSRI